MLTRYAFSILLLFSGMPAFAAEPDDTGIRPNQAVFGFGGIFTNENMGRSLRPLRTTYEENVLAGIGYQRFVFEREAVSLGFEAGGSLRAGGGVTGEVWSGAVARYDGLPTVAGLRLSPAFTFGLTAVSAPHRGREQMLEERYDGDATLLFYLGPEINLSHSSSGHEVFWRLHHRSGAWRTLGNMKGAMNANVVGIRLSF